MSEEQDSGSPRGALAENRTSIIFAVIALLAVVAVCVLAFMLIRPLFDDGDDTSVVDGPSPTPTPFPSVVGAGNRPGDDSLVVGISDSATISVALDIPVSLGLRGARYPVTTETVSSDGTWAPTLDDEETATWVYGTIINYVLGLRDTATNRELLGELSAGSELSLATRAGLVHTFSFSSREQVASNDGSVFAQTAPGITLLLVGSEGDQRTVVTGRYVVPEARDQGSASPVLQLGETAQFEDVQLTVSGASYLLDRPEAPPGFAFYLVNYQIQNISLTALDTKVFDMLLLDDLGNQYAMSPAASRLGNYPPIGGFLNSNQSLEATAGYQIPIGMSSPALSWVVTRSDSGGQVQVTIPFTGGPGEVRGASVTLAQAEVSNDLTSLILGGQVANLGEQPILVTEDDVVLTTADGSIYLLLSTNPPFPWTVAPGQSVQYLVGFQRPPAADTALFTVLNQPFELNGLR
jgi:hypothetical protein